MGVLPKKPILALVLGALIWVIAFIIGAVVMAFGFDQSVVSTVLSPISVILLLLFFWMYFNKVKMKELVMEGFLLGVVWLIVNTIFDVVVLLPLAGMDFMGWFTTIGIKYLAMPVETALLGYVIEQLK